MYCTNCGSQMPDTNRFCTKCGAPLKMKHGGSGNYPAPEPEPDPLYEDDPPYEPDPIYDPEPSPEPIITPKKGLPLPAIIGIAAAALAVIVAVVCVLVFGSSYKTPVKDLAKVVSDKKADSSDALRLVLPKKTAKKLRTISSALNQLDPFGSETDLNDVFTGDIEDFSNAVRSTYGNDAAVRFKIVDRDRIDRDDLEDYEELIREKIGLDAITDIVSFFGESKVNSILKGLTRDLTGLQVRDGYTLDLEMTVNTPARTQKIFLDDVTVYKVSGNWVFGMDHGPGRAFLESQGGAAASSYPVPAPSAAQESYPEPPHAEVDPEPVLSDYEVLNITASAENRLDIPAAPSDPVSAVNAESIVYDGYMTRASEEHFTLQAPRTGFYGISVTGMQADTYGRYFIYDEQGETVDSDSHISNNWSSYSSYLEAGRTYDICLYGADPFSGGFTDSAYTLTVWFPKDTLDISDASVVLDSMQFYDQENWYRLTAETGGVYTLEAAEMISEAGLDIYVYDALGEEVASSYHVSNHKALTMELEAGAVYSIKVVNYSDYVSKGIAGYEYQILVSRQKPAADITGRSLVTDSVEFGRQQNIYTYTASSSGIHRFDFAEMLADCRLGISVYNRLNECVDYEDNVRNGEGLSVELDEGETYRIVVENENSNTETGLSSYELHIGAPGDIPVVAAGMIVNDSIRYAGQENNYLIRPQQDGEIWLTFTELQNASVDVNIYDYLEGTMQRNDSVTNYGDVSFNVQGGKEYTISVICDSGFSGYSMRIDQY